MSRTDAGRPTEAALEHTFCGHTLVLGAEDEAICKLEANHDGDHIETWTTTPPGPGPRIQAEIRWREIAQ